MRLFRQPLDSHRGEQSPYGKWTGRTLQHRCHWSHCWTSDIHWTSDTAASPLSIKTGSPSLSQVSNCLRSAPINALKTQYTTSTLHVEEPAAGDFYKKKAWHVFIFLFMSESVSCKNRCEYFLIIEKYLFGCNPATFFLFVFVVGLVKAVKYKWRESLLSVCGSLFHLVLSLFIS